MGMQGAPSWSLQCCRDSHHAEQKSGSSPGLQHHAYVIYDHSGASLLGAGWRRGSRGLAAPCCLRLPVYETGCSQAVSPQSLLAVQAMQKPQAWQRQAFRPVAHSPRCGSWLDDDLTSIMAGTSSISPKMLLTWGTATMRVLQWHRHIPCHMI